MKCHPLNLGGIYRLTGNKASTFWISLAFFKRCFRGLPSYHGGASFKVEKAHFAAQKKGPENRKNQIKLRPPSVPPPETLYEFSKWRTDKTCSLRVAMSPLLAASASASASHASHCHVACCSATGTPMSKVRRSSSTDHLRDVSKRLGLPSLQKSGECLTPLVLTPW